METKSLRFYGRDGQLTKLKATMDDYDVPYTARKAAARAYYEIIKQCNDEKLMAMRLRLMRAAQAGDREWMARLSAQMKHYLQQDTESGGESA